MKAFNKMLGKVLNGIGKFLDDLFFLAGIASLTYAGFLNHEIAGFTVLGIGMITYGVLIARGGGGDSAC